MLNYMRKHATGLVAKIFMGLLVLSFGVWGIGDVFRNSGSKQNIVTMKGADISKQEFDTILNRMQQMYGEKERELTQSPQFRITLLNKMINQKIMARAAADAGLEPSQAPLMKAISNNPSFKGTDGKFNAARFRDTLRQNDLTEAMFMQKVREDLSAALVTETVTTGVAVPDSWVASLYKTREEQRTADLVMLDTSLIPPVAAPKEDEIKTFYEESKGRFSIPETRTLEYAVFSAKDALKDTQKTPDEAALKAKYEEKKASFATPEKRAIEQYLAPTQAAADSVVEKLKSGSSFDTLQKQDTKLEGSFTKLGSLTKEALPQEAADAVWALAEGTYSAPIQTSFGWHVFYVSKVEPARTASFDEVKDALMEAAQTEGAEQALNTLANTLEDALAAGSSLEEGMKSAGLTNVSIQTIENIEAGAERIAGATITPLQKKVIESGFSLQSGETSNLQLLDGKDYYLVRVKEVNPEHAQPLEEIKGKLIAQLQERATQRAMRTKAEEIAKELKAAKSDAELQKALTKYNLRLTSSGKIKREHDSSNGKNLTEGFIIELFNLKKNEVSSPYPLPDGQFVIGILRDVFPAPEVAADDKDNATMKDIRTELARNLPDEYFQQYLMYLRKKYDVEINMDALQLTPEE